MTTSLRDSILQNEKTLTAACGPALPVFSDAVRAQAEAAASQQSPVASAGQLPGWTGGISPHLVSSLAAGFAGTGDERFARAARGYFEHCLKQEPWDSGWRPSGAYDILAIPHRLGDTECVGWFGALPALLASPSFDDMLLQRIVYSGAAQLDHLAATVHDGRNIRMTQGDSLMTQSIRLAFLPQAPRWRTVGVRVLNDAFTRQFHDEGASIEGTGWYHHICAEMALRCWRIACAMPEVGLRVSAQRVARSFDYTLWLTQPDGRFSVLNDTTTSLPYASTVAGVMARRAQVRQTLGLPAQDPPTRAHFDQVQQGFARSSWEADADYVTFDSTRRIGWHWHPARNSVQIVAGGKRVLADPGRLAVSGEAMRKYAVSTAAHSTINLNGWDQSDADATLRTYHAPGYEVFEGRYAGGFFPAQGAGKSPGMYAEHHRVLVWVRGGFFVVLDNLLHHADAETKPALNLHWQFGPGRVALDASRGSAVFESGEARVQMLTPMAPAGGKWSLWEGAENPLRGWVVSEGDKPVPAPAVTATWERHDPWMTTLATGFFPFTGAQAPAIRTRVLASPDGRETKNVAGVAFDHADGRSDEVWWVRRFEYALDDKPGIDTDAPLLVIHRRPGGAVSKVLAVHATSVGPLASPRAERSTFVVDVP